MSEEHFLRPGGDHVFNLKNIMRKIKAIDAVKNKTTMYMILRGEHKGAPVILADVRNVIREDAKKCIKHLDRVKKGSCLINLHEGHILNANKILSRLKASGRHSMGERMTHYLFRGTVPGTPEILSDIQDIIKQDADRAVEYLNARIAALDTPAPVQQS